MIAFEELFPFGDLTRLLQQLQTEEKKLSSGRESFSQKYKETLKEEIALIAELKKQLQGISGINLKGDGLGKVGEEVDRVAKKVQGYKDLINALTTAEAANNASIEQLRGTLAQLKTQYDKLDPTASDFSATQQELAKKSMYVKQAMDAQLSTLKTATKTVKQVENSYAYLNAETGKLRGQLKNLPDAFDATTGAINKHNKVAVELQSQIQKNDRALKAMDASMGLHQRNVGNYSSAFSGLGSALVQFTGIAGGVDLAVTAITKSFEVISSFDRYRSVIRFASADTAAFNSNLAFLEKVADDAGMDVESLYKKFGSFSIAGKSANMTVAQTNNLFAAVAKAGGAYKMSNEGISLTLKAFEQIMNKNKLSLEEISQQLGDHMPGALGLFASALGVSTEKLVGMIKNGELFAKETLPLVADRLNKTVGPEAAKNIDTINGSWNRLTNQLKLFVDEFAREKQVAGFFATLNNGIANYLIGAREIIKTKGLWGLLVSDNAMEVSAFERNKADRIGSFGSLDKERQKAELLFQQKRVETLAKQAKEQQRIWNTTTINPNGQENLDKAIESYQKEKQVLDSMAATYKATKNAKVEIKKATAEETDEVKKMRKEYNALRNELKEATNKDKNYVKTNEGAAKLARYKELEAKLKEIDIAAGIADPDKIKEADTEVEKLTKSLTKLAKTLSDDALSDIRNKKPVSLNPEDLAAWERDYAALDKLNRIIGVEIPDSIEKMDNSLTRFQKKDILSKISNVGSISPTIPGFIMPNEEMKTAIGDKLPGIDAVLSRIKEEENERLRLKLSASRSLRGIKKDEMRELLRIQAEIHKAERDFALMGTDAEKDEARQRKEALKAEMDYKKDLYKQDARNRMEALSQALDIAQTIGQGVFEIQNAYRDREIEQINKKKDYELSLVENNATAQKAIEEKAAREIREVRIRQAKADKASALFTIAINTASAAIRAYAEGGIIAGIPLSAFVIAQGLAQAAIVAAKPLPEFAKGTQDAPEGPALVGEKGAELRKSGDKYYYYDKPTVAHLERGDKVYTATQTAEMFRNSMLSDRIERQFTNDKRGITNTQVINYQLDTAAIVDGIGKKLKEAFGEQPVLKQVLDDDQISTLVQRKGQLTKYYGKKHF